MPHLFDSFQSRDLNLPNRLIVSPMCQYSSDNGFANDWHLVHLGSRASGGAGLVVAEATGVTPEGRITPGCLGIYLDAHVEMLSRIVRFSHSQGCPMGIQIGHAGRKGSTERPWEGNGAVPIDKGGWQTVGPGTAPFNPSYPVPRALETAEIPGLVQAFKDAARRAHEAGFDMVEVHGAHGYLVHQFLSPLTNTRTDQYGGSFDNRIRLCLEVVDAVRSVWPERKPVWLRLSATDWAEGGWDPEQTVELARRVKDRGVDLIDTTTAGVVAHQQIKAGPGFQVPFAEKIRKEAGIPTSAVGLITDAQQADQIVRSGQADCVMVARELLRDPYFPLHAAQKLGVVTSWPPQYHRAIPEGTPLRTPLA